MGLQGGAQGKVVVFDQHGFEETGAVVSSAPAADGVLLQRPPAGSRLPRVIDAGPRAAHGIDVAAREGGDAREPAQHVQQRSFQGQHRPGGTFQGPDRLPRRQGLAIVGLRATTSNRNTQAGCLRHRLRRLPPRLPGCRPGGRRRPPWPGSVPAPGPRSCSRRGTPGPRAGPEPESAANPAEFFIPNGLAKFHGKKDEGGRMKDKKRTTRALAGVGSDFSLFYNTSSPKGTGTLQHFILHPSSFILSP